MKRGFRVGAVGGGVVGLAVALGMDLLLGKAAGGSWSQAVASDLGSLTGGSYPPGSLTVWAGVAAVVLLLGAVGAMMGGLAGALVGRLVVLLGKES